MELPAGVRGLYRAATVVSEGIKPYTLPALEERARSDLGMIARNETFYQVVPPPQATRTPTRTAAAR